MDFMSKPSHVRPCPSIPILTINLNTSGVTTLLEVELHHRTDHQTSFVATHEPGGIHHQGGIKVFGSIMPRNVVAPVVVQIEAFSFPSSIANGLAKEVRGFAIVSHIPRLDRCQGGVQLSNLIPLRRISVSPTFKDGMGRSDRRFFTASISDFCWSGTPCDRIEGINCGWASSGSCDIETCCKRWSRWRGRSMACPLHQPFWKGTCKVDEQGNCRFISISK